MNANTSSLQSRVIDWLRFPLAAAVVLLHAGEISEGVYGPDFYSTLRIILSHGICRIAVPAFFFFSGYLFFSKLENWDWTIWAGKVKKRARTLLLPYVLWNIIALLVGFGYGWLRSRFNTSVEPISFVQSLQDNGWMNIFWASTFGCPIDYPLWFIRDLIVFVAITPLVFLFVKYCKIWGVAALFIACILLGGDRDFEGLFFFAFGAYFRVALIDFLKLFAGLKWPAYLLSAVGLIAIALVYRSDIALYGQIKTPFMLMGVISVVNFSAFLLGKGLVRERPFLASASFFVYASHAILILHDIAHYITLHLLPFTSVIGQCAVLFVKTGLAIALCLGLYWALMKIAPRTLRVLTGNRA